MTEQPIRTLNGILAELKMTPLETDRVITNLALDSRKIVGGELFFAVPGFDTDGWEYVADAQAKGAAAILVQDDDVSRKALSLASPTDVIPVIFIEGLKDKIGFLADRYYRHLSQKVKITGFTGTNGKTSCCWFLSQMMTALGNECAIMGTIGQGFPGRLKPALNTTADVLSIHKYVAKLAQTSVPALAMEVSSHGLDQGRVNSLEFEVGVFTHISRDHLDYHNSLEEYALAKSRLFSQISPRHAVIGLDDQYSDMMIEACGSKIAPVTWSLENSNADVYASNIQIHKRGFTAQLYTPWGESAFETSLMGRFNLENLLAVISALGVQGFPLKDIVKTIPVLTTVPGRMQMLGGDGQPLVIVDYAHTSDALKSVLDSLREHGAERLICIYGCGGDRDRGKRPLMTRAALDGADRVVLTSDNPRGEKPEQIIADALENIAEREKQRVSVIVGRAEAIAQTIASARVDDLIVVAGKGHEDYQEIAGTRYPFDDREQVKMALLRRESASD